MVCVMSEMGKRIKQKRLEKGLTMEELGSKLGVKASAINKYEKGIVENIKRPTIKKMAEIFDCDPNWLMGFTEITTNDYLMDSVTDQYRREALALYGKYIAADAKTRKMIDMLLSE